MKCNYKINFVLVFIILPIFVLINCSKERNLPVKQESTCKAQDCHPATVLKQNLPQTGKHALHLVNGLICENCHKDYISNPKHKNGIVDVSTDADIVMFDKYSSAGKWYNSTGECSNLDCHGGGSAHINWYGDVTGGCAVCHSEGSAIDPLSTSGEGIKGKHIAHVVNHNIGCEICHYEYKSRTAHMNNTYGKKETETIIRYSGAFNSSNVFFNFNDDTGLCDNISCHGIATGFNWYSDASGCMACHTSGSINPMTTNGTNASGKHTEHVTNGGIECVTCHYDYKNNSQHMNGTFGYSLEPGNIVFFGGKWPSGGYDVSASFDSPSQGYCSAISCHGGFGNENWYASSSPACTNSCHAAGSKIGSSPIDASTSSHPAHISLTGITCEECHSGYKSASTHLNGTLNVPASTPGMLSFNSSRHPSGGYSGGQCSGIYCHGNFIGGNSSVNPTWGGSVNCSTNACHGGIDAIGSPADSVNPDSKHGTHVTAIMNIINPLTSFNYTKAESCTVCHSGHGYGTGSTHVNSQVDITFNYQNPEGGAMGTVTGGNWTGNSFNAVVCQSTYCHGNFAGGNTASVSWNDSVACGSCHPAGSTSPTSVKHTKHLNRYTDQCGHCHAGYLKNSYSGAASYHMNFKKDVYFGYPDPRYTDQTARNANIEYKSDKTCSNVYCHGNFPRVTYNGTPNVNTGNGANPIWLVASTAVCGSCHGNSNSNYSSTTHGSHTSQLEAPPYFGDSGLRLRIESCDACHNYGSDDITKRTFGTDSTQGSYNTIKHADFSINISGVNIDVNFKADNADLAAKIGNIISAKTTWDTGTTSCINSWCHGNFDNGSGVTGYNSTPNWLTPSTVSCGVSGPGKCHPLSHFGYPPPCSSCHIHATEEPYHIDGNIGLP